MTEFHKRSGKSRKNTAQSIQKHFESRRTPEDSKRLKQQRKQRDKERAGQGPRGSDWFDADGEVAGFQPMKRKRPPAGIATPGAAGAAPTDPSRAEHAGSSSEHEFALRVVGLDLGRATLAGPHGTEVVPLSAELAAVQQTALAVGDLVLCEGAPDGRRVVSVLPRRTELSRPDPGQGHRRRVIAANVDLAVLVLAVRRPAFQPGFIDRVLVSLSGSGIELLVAANKVDLLPPGPDTDELEQTLEIYRRIGVPALRLSAESGEGVAQLREALTGRAAVFLGHSGVGKSSLLNALDPLGERRVHDVRAGDGKGRHTTTRSSLTDFGQGTLLIDTPGVRAFGLGELSCDEVQDAFPELAEQAGACRFSDCSHLVEPGCAVAAALESGLIPRARFEAYARILASLEQAR